MRVFLSHSGRDKPLVRDIVSRLPPWLTGWIDEDRLLIGSDLSLSLREAINSEVDYLVLLFSDDAARSAWVQREVSWALGRETEIGRTFLLPVLIGDTRGRLSDFGLGGRVTLEIARFTDGDIRLLAEQLANHIGLWMSRALSVAPTSRTVPRAADSLEKLSESVSSLIANVSDPWRHDVESLLVRPFIADIAASRDGTIPLTPEQYYQRVLLEMRRADSTYRVLAVSTLSSELWTGDANQTRYAELNTEAALRGAEIMRLFVLPEVHAHSFAEEIHRQGVAGIEMRVSQTGLWGTVTDLEDFVLFETQRGARAYIAQQSIDGSRRIRKGTLVLSEHALRKRRDAFHAAWELASSPSAFYDETRTHTRVQEPTAPGLALKARHLNVPVITCEEAALARKIPLANELKTLLLRTHSGIVAAHLPGDGILSLRKVKDRLEASEAYLADPEDLLGLALSAGTVCAVLDPVWSMPHLISRRLLNLSTVMTNNGTRTGYFEFRPAILTEAVNVIVDDFER